MYGPPTVDDVAARLSVPPDTPNLPRVLDVVLNAALEAQANVCVTDPYSAGLHEAALRRAAFLWTSQGHSLGVLATGDFGVQYMPMHHPDWDLLEAPHRTVWVA